MIKWMKRFIALFFIGFLLYLGWLLQLNSQISNRLEQGWFLPPVEIYSSPDRLWAGKKVNLQEIETQLKNQNFKQATSKINNNEYQILDPEQCNALESFELEITSPCIHFRPNRTDIHLVTFNENTIQGVYSGTTYIAVPFVELKPELFAHFYGEQPLQKEITALSETPLQCLQAITAIEDERFLSHQGISLIGILRAAVTNVINFGVKQGASTITQQLIKNYFLTPERTFSRKIKEISMALIIELRFDKDTILENYLNVIYMGQNGSYQVRGYGAAAKHYFNKPLKRLNLNECAMMAALVNSPGRYNPYTRKEPALKRRNLVLMKMNQLGMLDSEKTKQAQAKPLPLTAGRRKLEPAAYFVQAIFKELKSLNIETEQGLKVYSSLNLKAQSIAKQSVQKALKELETKKPKLLENKGHKLQASLVSVDTHTGAVIALIGGRDYRQTQYNRVLEAHRQVGSIMKPIVYATALESLDEDGNEYTALSTLIDEKFTHKYDNQSWSPRNYSKTFQGPVPLFYALKNSLNIPTAKLGLNIGLDSVIDLTRRLGVESKIEALPSLSLGAYELYTYEVAQAYSSIANMGKEQKLHWINKIEDLTGNQIYKFEPKTRQVLAPETAAELIGMLKQTVQTGTARSLVNYRGFNHPAAGKTGTTSDTKDAWFVGFTPHILTIVWVGFDNNKAHGLTGASGALPIWSKFMKAYATNYPPDDFNWPENVEKIILRSGELRNKIQDIKEHEIVNTEIIIRKHLNNYESESN